MPNCRGAGRSLQAQRSLYDMSSGTRFRLLRWRLLWVLVGLAVVGILREASIRRHIQDLSDWPHNP